MAFHSMVQLSWEKIHDRPAARCSAWSSVYFFPSHCVSHLPTYLAWLSNLNKKLQYRGAST